MLRVFSFIILWMAAAFATANADVTSKYYFSHITSEDGLSQMNVKTVIQDSYGFMWFGTKNGLNRFDGTIVTQKNLGDISTLTGNNNVSALYEDNERMLWVGTDRGVFRYNPSSDVFTAIDIMAEDSVWMENWVADIVGDRQGNVWIVIPDQGVFRYNSGKLSFYGLTDKDKMKMESISCITVRRNGEVWIGSWGAGLFRYDAKEDSFRNIVADSNGFPLENLNISAICDYGKSLVVGCHEGEVLKYNPDENQVERTMLTGADYVRTLKWYDNELWVGTRYGLYVVNEDSGIVLRQRQDLMNPFSLSDNDIFCIYRDREDGLWIGTMFGGVNYLPAGNLVFEKFMPAAREGSLTSKFVRELAVDSKNRIWIGTEDDGINVMDIASGRFASPDFDGKECGGLTLSMYAWDNYVACGLFKKGLMVYDVTTGQSKWHPFEEMGLEEGSVYAMLVDSKGGKWIGTGWGLCKAEPGSWKFRKVEAVGFDWIFDAFEDSSGNLWFASMGSGLWKYVPGTKTFTKYFNEKDNPKSLSSNSVSSIMQDKKGNLWFSTDRGGICRYNLQTDDFTRFSIKEGLPDDVAYEILEDDMGYLWFGTNRGLVRLHPDTGNMRVYTTRDGLPCNQFNYKSAVKAPDGKFYFGSINGLIAFNPNDSEAVSAIPPICFSQLSINNEEITVHSPDSPLKQSIEFTDRLSLPHDQTNISLKVALLSYSTAGSNVYEYKLVPLDKDWIKVDNNQRISYAKLPTGNYTLMVRANNGKSNGDYATRQLRIEVLPPWWLSLWAKVLYFLMSVGAVYGWFVWYRGHKNRQMEERHRIFTVEKEKELNESKVRFFTEIAHEIRTPLTLINGPLESIEEMGVENERLKKYLGVIGQNTKRLLKLANELLDFHKIGASKLQLKIETVDVAMLLRETVGRFEPTFSHAGMNIECDISDSQVMADIDREAVTKILSNLLTNALKYGRHAIRVALSQDSLAFNIEVASDGEKISDDKAKQIFQPFYQIGAGTTSGARSGIGIGLPMARSLAELHQGSLTLDMAKPMNTFVLSIPLKQMDAEAGAGVPVGQHEDVLDEGAYADLSLTRGATLLLAEDNDDMLQFIKGELSEDFNVETASNGREALDILHKMHIDIVIADIMMPEMNGYELCRTIKEDIELSNIPVIFLTAKNDLDSKIKGLKYGAEAYVEKPFSMNYLKTQVVSLLSNRYKERDAFSKRPFFPVGSMQLSKADEEFMEKVVKVIQENIYDENFNVERLADILCMSRSSLLRKIKALFNMSPVDFIRLIRLKRAAELIQEGKHLIGDICYMVGINSPSYFGKLFSKQFGMTPKEFEKQVRAAGEGKGVEIVW